MVSYTFPTFLTLALVILFFEFLVSPIRGQSITVVNHCLSAVNPTASPAAAGYYSGGALASGSSVQVDTAGFSNGGFQLSFSTGCTDGTSCATGPDGSSPLFSAAFFQPGASTGSIMYNINIFDGFNVGIKVEPTGNTSSCPAFSCDGLSAGCPVPGPSGTCYSPCCESATSCAAGAPICALPGAHDSFFASKCPNAQSHTNYNTTMLPLTQTTCSGDVLVTLCPGETSNFTLAQIKSGDFQAAPLETASKSNKSNMGGVIAGAIIGTLVGLLFIAVLVYLFFRRRRALQTPGFTSALDEERKVGDLTPAPQPFHLSWAGRRGNEETAVTPYYGQPDPNVSRTNTHSLMAVSDINGPSVYPQRPIIREKGVPLEPLDTLGAPGPSGSTISASEGSSYPLSGYPQSSLPSGLSGYPLSSLPSGSTSQPQRPWAAPERHSLTSEAPPPVYEEYSHGERF